MDWRASIIPRIGRFHRINQLSKKLCLTLIPRTLWTIVIQMIPSKLIDVRLIRFSCLYNFSFFFSFPFFFFF